MRLADMSAEQRRVVQLFRERLGPAGWVLPSTEEMLDAKASVTPEGLGDFHSGCANLHLRYFAQPGMFSLTITSLVPGRTVMLEFHGVHSAQDVFQWVTRYQSEITAEDFGAAVKEIIPVCDAVYFVEPDGTMHQLQIPGALE